MLPVCRAAHTSVNCGQEMSSRRKNLCLLNRYIIMQILTEDKLRMPNANIFQEQNNNGIHSMNNEDLFIR
jgi:hypothetical protein